MEKSKLSLLYEVIDKDINKELTEKRYNHVLRVVEMSEKLAINYGECIEKCRVAAILHDYAKQFSEQENNIIIENYSLRVDKIEKESKELLHSKIAASIAEEKYKIHDIEILDAIRFHTTGRAGMSLIEKIIFVADAVEMGRDYPLAQQIREVAFESLDKAIVKITGSTIVFLVEKNSKIHPNTIEARNYYLDNI